MSKEKTFALNIWGERKSETYFRRRFTLKGKPSKAVLRIFVDTGYELLLNGRFISSVNEWNNTRDYDVTPFLVRGGNIIAVKGVNYGGHRGFALELKVEGLSRGAVGLEGSQL